MKTKIKDKNTKYYLLLLISSFLLYLMSICIKVIYSAQLVSIIPYFNTTKSDAGLGLTFYYASYGIVQLLIATKFKIKNMKSFMISTTVLSAISFGAVIFTTQIWQVWIILTINGFFQSSVWGGTVHFLGKYLPDSWSATSSLVMSFGLAIGTALSYGASAFFVAISDWRYTFLFFAVIMLITLVLFCLSLSVIDKKVGVREDTFEKSFTESRAELVVKQVPKRALSTLMTIIFLASLVSCSLYHGVLNWVPSLLKEVHNVDESYSLLITILLPVGMMFGPAVATSTCEKYGHVFTVCSVFTVICAAILLLLAFFYDLHIVVAIVLSLLLLFFIRGIVNTLAGYLPLKLKHVVNSGNNAMIINAASCFGAAAMPFITGLIMDKLGWQSYYFITLGVCVLLLVVFVIGVGSQKKDHII